MDTDERPMGAVLADDGGGLVLRYVRHLGHPPEKVWRALTESAHLEHWLPCDIVGERRAGASVELVFWPAQVERFGIEDAILPGQIRVWEPPSVFEWSWDTELLRWELAPDGDGTRLTFTVWPSDGEDRTTGANKAAGYHLCLEQLEELLDEGEAPPLEDADIERWHRRYAAALGVPAVSPTGEPLDEA